MAVYTARHSSWMQDFYSVSIPGPLFPTPTEQQDVWLPILLAYFVQKKEILPFLRVKPSSVCFTTCSLVTILVVFCRLPLFALLWFIKGRAVECSLILSCVLGFKTLLEEGSTAVTELNYPAVSMVKLVISVASAVGSDLFSSALRALCSPYQFLQVYSSCPLVPNSLFVTPVQALSINC